MEDFFDFTKPFAREQVCRKPEDPFVDTLPIAMAYVPVQKLKTTYEPAEGLFAGTMFPELYKPFTGCKKGRA